MRRRRRPTALVSTPAALSPKTEATAIDAPAIASILQSPLHRTIALAAT
jgi:hypothetical protein